MAHKSLAIAYYRQDRYHLFECSYYFSYLMEVLQGISLINSNFNFRHHCFWLFYANPIGLAAILGLTLHTEGSQLSICRESASPCQTAANYRRGMRVAIDYLLGHLALRLTQRLDCLDLLSSLNLLECLILIPDHFRHHRRERSSHDAVDLDQTRAGACWRALAACAAVIMELTLALGGALEAPHLQRSPLPKHHLHRGLPLIIKHFS